MKADLSRNTFDRARHYSAVRLQQGRIVTDADWNEQADLTRYRAERLALDAIGGCGGPVDGAGYALVAETNALAVTAVNEDSAWVVGEDGALLRSDDGGASWTLVDVGTTAHLRAVAVAGSAIWVVGDDGTILRSTDGGTTWPDRGAGSAGALFGVAATDGDHAWAVGDGGLAFATADGGLTWVRVQTEAAHLYAIDVSDGINGLAVGRAGIMVATHDGGATWSGVASGTDHHLRAIARIGATRICVAGDGGTIRYSDDGVAWNAATMPPNVTAPLYAFAFRDDGEGWAAGDDGALLHSSDDGETWSMLDAGASLTLRGLAVTGTGAAWAVGDGSTLLRIDTGSPEVMPGSLPAVNLSIEPGRYWVQGMLCELETRCSYAHQADGGAAARLTPGIHLIYLDAWQRHVSALQAPEIREVALGGPDTATRARGLAQVRALPLPVISPNDWSCVSEVDAWDDLLAQPRPRLAARAEPQLAPASVCEIAATAGYRRLENQLYRVEVHEGGASPTFKWSRENASVEYAVVSLTVDEVNDQTIVRVAARGRDSNLDLAVHDRVELVDDDSEATARAGTVLEYVADGDDELELVLAGVPPGTLGRDPARHPLLRRWDQHPETAGEHVLTIVEGTWIELEEGVQVRFELGGVSGVVYRPGDYWQIPARTITADVEWPRSDDGDPLALAPAGVADAYCRIGIVEVADDGSVSILDDCRTLFPPLTAMVQILYGGGDGQDEAPNALLPQPLEVHVHRGGLPLADSRVSFAVETGAGGVGPEGGPMAASVEVPTNVEGHASCRWTLGPGLTAPSRHQRVVARLLDAGGTPVSGQSVVFAATAWLTLQYAGGDGQQAAAGAALANPIVARVEHGGEGVAGYALVASASGGGNATASTSATDTDGKMAFNWRLGNSGAQSLSIALLDSDGNAAQSIAYTASIAATTTGGCAVTIGPGGQFDRLDNELLLRLLNERKGDLCLCFLPGTHQIDSLHLVAGLEGARLILHGCGPTAVVVTKEVVLQGFTVLEMRDLSVQLAGDLGVTLENNGDVRLRGLNIDGVDASVRVLLSAIGADRLRMHCCTFGQGQQASAVIAEVANECHVTDNRFDGTVSFYGLPGKDRLRELINAYANSPDAKLVAGTSRLHFANNEVGLLAIADTLVEQLLALEADGLFQSAVLQGNTFNSQSNVFASGLVNFADNSFLAQPTDGSTPYGVVGANRATAAGNVAVVNGDAAILHFLRPRTGGFSGAANQIFTSPPSLN